MDSLVVGRRADRSAVIGSLVAITALAWVVTLQMANGMKMPSGGAAMSTVGAQLLLASTMWAAMMVGMMVPSATPMVVAFTDWTRRGHPDRTSLTTVPAFLGGYLVVWLGFSLLAAGLQVTFQRTDLLTTAGVISRPTLGGSVLVLAGLFQATTWKESCLRRCRTPTGFLIAEWREGPAGALVMGIRHGTYCLGCCWALMAVLFAVGTMHLAWMAAITVFVLVEKVAPRSLRVSQAAAVMLVVGGAWTAFLG